MRPARFDLRVRIAAVLAAVCILVVGGVGFTLYLASLELEKTLVEELVNEELDSLVQRGSGSEPYVSAAGPNLQYYAYTSAQDAHVLPARVRDLGPGHHEIGSGVDKLHVAIREASGRRYVVVYDASLHETRAVQFLRLLVLAMLAVAVVVVVLAYWLGGVLTRHLTQLAERVRNLAPDEPHPPLAQPNYEREVAALAHALDEYNSRILDMIQREQEFSANASHELRTPLTAIRTSCELLFAYSGVPEQAKRRIVMIDAAASQMTECIETLLYLARPHQASHRESFALRRCVEEVAARYEDELARKGLRLDVAVDENEQVRLDRKALQLVLANLVKNAIRYTERGFVRIAYQTPRLSVTDSGRGIEAKDIPQLFDRYYRTGDAPDGLGLGLSIVRRICADLGWEVKVDSCPGSGSTFTIVLV